MKQCVKCKLLKDSADFYRHSKNKDGLQAYCKSCSRHSTSPVKRKPGQRKAWREREKLLFPERWKARKMVANRLRDGLISRKPCEVCGASKVEAHHEDYSKPLEIRWLCQKHHHEVHLTLRSQ